MRLNETHDPSLRSWVATANDARSDFPIQNLPFGIFRRHGSGEIYRGGVAIGDQVLDLDAAWSSGAFPAAQIGLAATQALSCARRPVLNDLMSLGPAPASDLRLALSRALRHGSAQQALLEPCLVGQADAEMALPALVGDYTDFYTSLHHATAVGKLMRPDNPLLPNYKWVPIGYHGRSSSIGVSGQTVRRPLGQRMPPGGDTPVVGPSERLDYELELGVFIGLGNELGSPVHIAEADSHIFGMCLLNDWSARDLQAWEYQPLGPFLGKNFATTISAWVVTWEALAPYRIPWVRAAGEPQPLPYLYSPQLRDSGAIDIALAVYLETERMRAEGIPPYRLSHSNFRDCYWSVAQMVAHHTVNGCNLRPGDLLGTGTQSGPTPAQAGSLLELSFGGKQPLTLPNGEQRRFLSDGDAIILRAACERAGHARVGFGEARGRVGAAPECQIDAD
ncbi:MAG TPA: fumarylacetoacetase [Steroidobacteraceae bacterium]|nr:fumarylacetoacetase [Steroidobacteraceae bacterium]